LRSDAADADNWVEPLNNLSSRPLRVARSAVVALAIVGGIAAPSRADRLPARPPSRVGASAASTGVTSVLGVAWRMDNTPIAGAQVQLRNLVSAKVDARAVANEAGQFTFSHIEGGTYAVELLGESGRIVTVGHAFVIAPGETVATFVRLGTRVPWFAGFFNNAAAAVASSAASQGITAIAPVQLSESSGNPPK
jgi:hypothetical protein